MLMAAASLAQAAQLSTDARTAIPHDVQQLVAIDRIAEKADRGEIRQFEAGFAPGFSGRLSQRGRRAESDNSENRG